MWVQRIIGLGWRLKMVRHGNGPMAKNLTTGKFQDVSLSFPEWQLREAICLSKNCCVWWLCPVWTELYQSGLYAYTLLNSLKKGFNVAIFPFYPLGSHTINASSNLISANFCVNNRFRHIPEITTMMQKEKFNIANPIYTYMYIYSW